MRTLFDRPQYPDPLKRDAVQKELLYRLSHLPGVNTVAAASHLPLSGDRQIGFRLENAPANEFRWAENSLVSPEYFRAMGMSVLRGRDISYGDTRSTQPVAVVNQTIYLSLFQVESGASARTAFIMRLARPTEEGPQGIFTTVQQVIWAVDKDLPTYNTTTLAALVSESAAQPRFTALLMNGFALIALVLASIGLFGVVSYAVSERTRELRSHESGLGSKAFVKSSPGFEDWKTDFTPKSLNALGDWFATLNRAHQGDISEHQTNHTRAWHQGFY